MALAEATGRLALQAFYSGRGDMNDLTPAEHRDIVLQAVREALQENRSEWVPIIQRAISDWMSEQSKAFSLGVVRWMLHAAMTAIFGGLVWAAVTHHWPQIMFSDGSHTVKNGG